MKSPTASEVRSFLLDRFVEQLEAKDISAEEVPDDFDLLYEGIIDSLGILEMIAAVERRFLLEIDFEGLDAEELTVLGPFCRYIEAEKNRSSQ